MKPLSSLSRAFCAAVIGTACVPAHLSAQSVWDNGGTTSQVAGAGQTPLPVTLTTTTTGGDIIGGERDLILVLENKGNNGASANNFLSVGNDAFFGGAYIDVAHAAGVGGTATVVWDGVDGSSAINYTGLGGVNLSAANSGIEFNLTKDGPPSEWIFRFYTDATRFSEYSVVHGAGVAIDPPGTPYSIPFTSFNSAGSVGAADFSNIGAITITIVDSAGGLDTAIGGYGFVAIPEPGNIGLLSVAGLLLFQRSRRSRGARSRN